MHICTGNLLQWLFQTFQSNEINRSTKIDQKWAS